MCPKAVRQSVVRCVYGLSGWSCLRLNTGAYLIAVFAFGVASMKADRVFDDVGQEQHRTHQRPQWYSDTFGCGVAMRND
jgi:hypothetical protein